MVILVTGANGQLGTELRNVSKGSGDRYIFSDVSQVPGSDTLFFDITNQGALKIVCESESVDVIVNCAAYTNVEKAEEDPQMADLLNHKAPANLAAVAAETGALLIHISTDYIFNGEKSVPYAEDDAPDPLGVYGVTKLAGEDAIKNSGCRYMIFRTAWLYSPYGKNFIKTILGMLQSGRDLKVVYDQIGSPTYAEDLARLIYGIVSERKLDKTGVYHYTDEGAVSWYDVAMAIKEISGAGGSISPCLTVEYPTKASRPHFSLLDKSKVRSTFGIEIPYWKDSLVKCIDRL
ncbi:MAG: dTDP-4-dehydrorhamnose reductase [Bacteroidales bacterium]|nr:dTDP-4-dehydrorhamnose reductase [Bacteroidales bacterium]